MDERIAGLSATGLEQAQPGAMTCLQVVRELSREGGAETVAFELDASFRAIGVRSSVMTSRTADVSPDADLDLVAPWLLGWPSRGRWRYLGRLFVVPLFTIAATLKLGRRGNAAVVISHGDSFRGDMVVIHAINVINIREKRRAGEYWWLLNPMHYWVLARDWLMIRGLRYRRYVAVSRRVADDLEDVYGVPRDRIRIIPNGINPSRFHPCDEATGRDRATIREEFAIPADAKLLLFAGHEFERKGLRFIIEALERLDDDVHLLVVGSDNRDPYIDLAQRLAVAKRIVFAGHRADMPVLYRAADLFVLPSAYETFSLVCMEALASGVPVVVTAVGGVEDYVVDGINGVVIERDAASIQAAVSRICADPRHIASMRSAAVASSRHFTWDAIATKYLALAHEIAVERLAAR